VDTGILSRLDLRPTGSTSMHTPSTGAAPHVADLYDVSIVVPGAGPHHAPLVIPALAVTDANFAARGIDALIGRDVLRDCLMVYNGTAGVFTLAF
jgi:hypothetical protein